MARISATEPRRRPQTPSRGKFSIAGFRAPENPQTREFSADGTARVPADAIDEAFIQNLGVLIRRLSADAAIAIAIGMPVPRHYGRRLSTAR